MMASTKQELGLNGAIELLSNNIRKHQSSEITMNGFGNIRFGGIAFAAATFSPTCTLMERKTQT
ncbi:hypothetical protein D0T90_06510 [Neisseria animalis]|uniref:Uncharacterized protein n=1 Tax=Neisseria animalis TaxID=492 RepID=A0A5P3MRG8_NEIAN|nr:hypothetical protein D0T90_06510 [Neisseria animalis]ROW32209.1 hypothetical protein CGZ60_06480 [Neisseria animalis]